jgi:hypothetical protein
MWATDPRLKLAGTGRKGVMTWKGTLTDTRTKFPGAQGVLDRVWSVMSVQVMAT